MVSKQLALSTICRSTHVAKCSSRTERTPFHIAQASDLTRTTLASAPATTSSHAEQLAVGNGNASFLGSLVDREKAGDMPESRAQFRKEIERMQDRCERLSALVGEVGRQVEKHRRGKGVILNTVRTMIVQIGWRCFATRFV